MTTSCWRAGCSTWSSTTSTASRTPGPSTTRAASSCGPHRSTSSSTPTRATAGAGAAPADLRARLDPDVPPPDRSIDPADRRGLLEAVVDLEPFGIFGSTSLAPVEDPLDAVVDGSVVAERARRAAVLSARGVARAVPPPRPRRAEATDAAVGSVGAAATAGGRC